MRDLRGQRSEDVIYAGPRRSLGAAEVALTFEGESAGQSESSWPAENTQRPEMSLARRLYRSGESDYLVNRQKARLRDVFSALRGLGIDAGHHVIVNQGMADALLAATALERRGLLEQAAGLSPYRDTREEARHKLSSIAQNIESAQLILAELEPRLRLLRRQAKAVEERDEAIQILRLRLGQWYAVKWRGVEETRRLLQADIEAAAGERKLAADELERLESAAETAIQAEREWHRSLDVITASLNISEREQDAVTLDLEHLRQRIDIGERAREQHHERVSQLQLLLEEARRRQVAAENALTELRASRIEQEMRQPSARSTMNALQKELGQIEQQTAEHHALLAEAEGEQGKISDAALKTKSALTEHAHLLGLMERRLADSIESLAEASLKSEQLERDVAQAAGSERRAVTDLEMADGALALHRTRAERLNTVVSRARLLSVEANGKLASAEALLSRLSLQMNNSLIESLKVKAGWERAIASALGGWSKAGGGSSEYRLHEADPSDFLAWRKRLQMSVGPQGRWADGEVNGSSDRPLYPLVGTILVDDEEQAQHLWARLAKLPAFEVGSPPIQIISRSGQRWSALGVKRYAEDNATGKYLSARSEVVELGRRAQRQLKRRQALESARSSAETVAKTLESSLQAASAAAHAAQAKRGEVTVAYQRLQNLCVSLNVEREQGATRTAEITAKVATLHDEMNTLRASEGRANDQLEKLQANYQTVDAAAQEVKRKIVLASEQVAKARQDHEALVARETTHVEAMQLAQSNIDRLSQELESHLQDQQRLTLETEILEIEIRQGCDRLNELEMTIKDQRERLDRVRTQRPMVEQALILREVRNRHLEIVSGHERLLATSTQLEIERDNLRAEIWREVEIEPTHLPLSVEEAPTDDEIRRLRQKAVQYPEADQSVVSEYEDITHRQDYLRQHLEDLNAARDNLTEIMQVADSEMRARFATAFEAVNEEFGRVFQIMLRGGSARLEQIDQDGAVEIRAQLPGRRALSSHAFSGGERALVASSLLFGVLRIKPAPFCILDEVDAPLDESNVDRYLNVLRELSETTQMIVVTHNRATMAAADALYGLTMDDEGVSSLLSLRLDAYEPAV